MDLILIATILYNIKGMFKKDLKERKYYGRFKILEPFIKGLP